MPLVEMKSNLSHIATNFGSDTTTANVPNKSRFISSRTTDLENAIPPIPVSTTEGVNYFLDIDATGFTVKRKYPDTDFKLNSFGQPRREQQMYLDMKGDFSPLYTMFHTAEPVFRVGSPNPGSPMENIPTVNSDGTPINSLYNRASTPNRMGFSYIPEFEDTNRYPTVRPTTTEQSRIYFKHTTDKSGIDNAGFTRPGLGLSNYYDQLIAETGILGIRNESSRMLKNDNQPFVVRDIGSSWEIGEVTGFGTFGTLMNLAADLVIDSLSTIYGRDPDVYIKSYMASAVRTFKGGGSPFNPLDPWIIGQTNLQRKNAQQVVTTAKYELDGGAHTLGEGISHYIDKDTDLRSYSVKHLYSTPLQNQTMFTRFDDPDLGFIEDFLGGGISGFIAGQLTDVFDDAVGYLKKKAIDYGKQVFNQAKKWGTGKLLESEFYKKNLKGKVDDVNRVKSWYNTTKDYQNQASTLASTLKGLEGVSDAFGHGIGKPVAEGVGLDLFDVGVDKVNLIPYGTDKQKNPDKSFEELDFIPFKFYNPNASTVGKEDNEKGASIVFRALLSGITDTFSPEYTPERYIGRPDNVYVYQGTDREIGFTFDIYPKSINELAALWKKLNYLAGLTYPSWASAAGGGMGMIAPSCELTIGQMYTDTPGYISALTYTVQDNGTWETTVAKLPKYIQVSCTFVHIGNRLPSSDQKQYELPWVPEKKYETPADILGQVAAMFGGIGGNEIVDLGNTAYRGFKLRVIPDTLEKPGIEDGIPNYDPTTFLGRFGRGMRRLGGGSANPLPPLRQ